MARKLLLLSLVVTLAAAAVGAPPVAALRHAPVMPSSAVPAMRADADTAVASPSSSANGTLADLVATTADLSLFLRALTAVKDLLPVLTDQSAVVTAFVPTNEAFVALAGTLGYNGPPEDEEAAWGAVVAALTRLGAGNPLPLLRTILKYHFLAGGAQPVRVEELAGTGPVETREGGTLSVRADLSVADRAPDVADATVIEANVEAANGVAHLVDRVLLPTAVGASLVLPPPESVTLVQLASVTPELSLMIRALNTTGLLQLIANPAGNVTVLPPSNSAWVVLAETLGYTSCGGCDGGDDDPAYEYLVGALAKLGGGDPLPMLTSILSFHLLPRRAVAAEIVAAGPLVTLRGSQLAITPDLKVVDLAPGVPNGLIVEANVATSNGVAHLVNRVLLPVPIWPTVGGGGD